MKLSDIRNFSREDLLDALGLEQKHTAADWILPGIGLFAAGLLVGAGLGLILAPKSGAELRADLAERMAAGQEKISEQIASAQEPVGPGL